MRSTHDIITFKNAFTLRGLDGEQPSGAYKVITDEEEIPGLSFLAWRRVSTQIYLPAIGVASAQEQATMIEPADLVQAQTRDCSGRFQ